MKPHHVHAALSGGTKARAPVSLDIGRDCRVRLDCGDDSAKPTIARRLAVVWNMHEGIPTEVLEAGAVRRFYDAVGDLLRALATTRDLEIKARVGTVVSAWESIAIEPTADGRRAECACSEIA